MLILNTYTIDILKELKGQIDSGEDRWTRLITSVSFSYEH